MPEPQRGAQHDRVREIEVRLFEEIGTQLKGVTDAMRELTLEMRDVRERLIRIEAQDQPQKIAKLETELRATQDEIGLMSRQFAEALAQLAAAEAAERAKLERELGQTKGKLEQRLQRMEIIIAPITVGGSAFLAAVIGALVTLFSGHIH
jgi:chromosome segregation ATPase